MAAAPEIYVSSASYKEAAKRLNFDALMKGVGDGLDVYLACVDKPSEDPPGKDNPPQDDMPEELRELGDMIGDTRLRCRKNYKLNARELHHDLGENSPVCLHFIGHASYDGTVLDDGVFDNEAWKILIQNSDRACRFVFLSCCNGFVLAEQLFKLDSVWVVIATSSEIPSDDARKFAQGVWENLLELKQSFWTAACRANALVRPVQRDQYRIYCKMPELPDTVRFWFESLVNVAFSLQSLKKDSLSMTC